MPADAAITGSKLKEKIDKTGAELGIASDGLVYLFVDGEPVGTGIALGNSADVWGYVDENNVVTLTGNLTDGNIYAFKFEMEDGTTIDIGEPTLSSDVKYSVTNNLTNCTNSNSAVNITKNESYTATISADSGYELSSVVVTMGGTDISSTAVSDGTISIESVTGNIVITAVAEETATRTNFAGELTTGRLSNSASGNIATDDGGISRVTEFIAVTTGDIVSVQGYNHTKSGSSITLNYMVFDSSKTKLGSLTAMSSGTSSYVTIQEITDTGGIIEITSDSAAYIRFSGIPSGSDEDIIVNIQRNGEWL